MNEHSADDADHAVPEPPADLHNIPAPDGLGDLAWIGVIQKMDEVYSDLLKYEVALEEKNAALEENQRFILSVLTSMSDVLIVTNRQGTIQDVNESLVRLTGIPDGALRGRSVFDLLTDGAARDRLQHMLAAGETVHDCECGLCTPGGGSITVSLNFTARYSAVGKMLGCVITGRPVGELRRAYDALREAHEELKRTQQQLLHAEKMASLGRLVAGVAHELNNPISFIIGNVHAIKRYAQRLQRYLEALHGGAPAEQCEQLRAELRIDRIVADLDPLIEGTVEGAERTRDIVDSLKRFSAIDREENVDFDLGDVVQRAVHWVQKAGSARFAVTLDLAPGLRVMGSPGQMQQVMMNLVQNAQDATAQQAEPRLRVSAERRGNRALVRFHDNGPGIDPAALPRVFDPFFTTKAVGKGTGLGLSISYGIVERHGGHLEATNHVEGGAVFTVTLPLLPEAR